MSGAEDTDDRPGTDETRDRSEERTDATTDPAGDGTESARSETETAATETAATETAATETPTTEYATEADVEALREDVAAFADDLEERTVDREDLESDLRGYVRSKVRRGHARGWGPYLVLLYGTAMTIGAFYSPFLGGGWAILAMFVIWLSVLGLYVLFVLVGAMAKTLSLPVKLLEWRS